MTRKLFIRFVEFYKKNVVRAKQIFDRTFDVKRILKSIRKYCKSNQERNDSSNIEHDFNMQKTIINCEI